MNRREFETLLLTLESTPVLLARAAESLPPGTARRRPAAGGFSFVENVWHLADLEREGFGVRIRRILSEPEPTLSNFDGDRIARERDYWSRSVAPGIAVFGAARMRNVELLRGVAVADWRRRAIQDGVGVLTLADIPRNMAEHDRSHTADIAALLTELEGQKPGTPVSPAGMHRVSAFA
jgi:hypothetical protein